MRRGETPVKLLIQPDDGIAPLLAGIRSAKQTIEIAIFRFDRAELEKELTEDKGWRIRHVQTGGEALDSASQVPPMILVAKENLPDLTGSMVVKTIKASVPSLIAMVFAPPAQGHAGEQAGLGRREVGRRRR